MRFSATKSDHWIDRSRHEKNRGTDPNHDVIHQYPQTPNLRILLNSHLHDYTSLWSSHVQPAAQLRFCAAQIRFSL